MFVLCERNREQLTATFRGCENPARVFDRLACGQSIVVAHERGASLVFGAATATAVQTAFAVRHSSGFLQVVLPTEECDRLLIPRAAPMFTPGRVGGHHQCAGVDAAAGISTGISASDRARTARLLARSDTTPEDLIRPGHVIVVAVDKNPGLSAAKATSIPQLASAALTSATGNPSVVVTELVNDADPANLPSLQQAELFSRTHNLLFLTSSKLSELVGER